MFASGQTGVIVDQTAAFANVTFVSSEFFDVFRVKPLLGRTLASQEHQRGADAVAAVSERFWRQQLGADPKALGKTLRMENRAFTIVGVLPFRYPGKTDVWYSSGQESRSPSRTAHNYRAVARLKPGVSVEQARSSLETIAARLADQHPADNKGKSATAILLKRTWWVTSVGT